MNEDTSVLEAVKEVDKKADFIKTIREYLMVIIGSMLLALLITRFIGPGQVNGHSMDYTLSDGEILLIDKVSYKHKIEHNDIAVVNTNVEGGKILIKRVIGVAGDEIKIQNDQVYRNGELLNEDYIKEPMVGNKDMTVVVPEGKMFLMGDNRNNSLDSRSLTVGLVDVQNDTIGTILCSVDSKFITISILAVIGIFIIFSIATGKKENA